MDVDWKFLVVACFQRRNAAIFFDSCQAVIAVNRRIENFQLILVLSWILERGLIVYATVFALETVSVVAHLILLLSVFLSLGFLACSRGLMILEETWTCIRKL